MNGQTHGEPRVRRLPPLVQWLLILIAVVSILAQAGYVVVATTTATFGESGLAVDWGHPAVTAVLPNSPAGRAGLRAGDHIDLQAMTLRDRLALGPATPFAGTRGTVVVRRDGFERTISFTYAPRHRTLQSVLNAWSSLLLDVYVAVICIAVLARYPSWEAAVLWTFGQLWFQISGVNYPPLDALNVATELLGDVFSQWALGAAVVLALIAAALPRRRRYAQITMGVASAIAVASALMDAGITAGVYPPATLWWLALNVPGYLQVVCVFAVIVPSARRASGMTRVRLQWFGAGFLFFVGVMTIGVAVEYIPGLAFSDSAGLAETACSAVGFFMISYSIVRHDLFGLGFVVNRATIYTIVTAIVVGTFAGANWAIGTVLKSTGIALPVDIVLAGLAGLSLNLVQRRVNVLVDRTLFRQRYEAARRLRRTARSLVHASDERAIVEAVVIDPCEALELHAAALFVRGEDDDFRRLGDCGWPPGAPLAIVGHDRLVTYLAGGDDVAVRLDDVPHTVALPHGAPRPRIAFPLWSRRELIAIAFYSAHRNGATLDPEEVDEVERITSAASAAFDRVAASALRRTQDELAAARAEIARLTALVRT